MWTYKGLHRIIIYAVQADQAIEKRDGGWFIERLVSGPRVLPIFIIALHREVYIRSVQHMCFISGSASDVGYGRTRTLWGQRLPIAPRRR